MRLLFLSLLLICSNALAFPESIQVYNTTTNKVVVGKNSEDQRSIASVTKLMTAMVYLDQSIDLDTRIDLVTKVRTFLPKQQYSRRNLLNAMLVKSDNAAAESLAHDYPGGREEFIAAMNSKAKSLGMEHTVFEDASGLSRNNLSTAGDISKMLIAAQSYPFIVEVSTKKETEIETKKSKSLVLRNTNTMLLSTFDNIVLSKTGYTTPAGFCVAFVVKHGKEIFTVVILGSKNLKERLDIAKYLIVEHILVN